MGIFSRKKKKVFEAEKMEAPKCFEDELTILNQKLIENTKKELSAQYRKLVAGYSPKNPLPKDKAEEFLLNLIEIAVANRKLLGSEIECSISEGDIYAHYYNRLTIVNELANEAHVDMQHMKNAEERYEHKLRIYNNITSGMYMDAAFSSTDVHKKQSKEDKGKQMDRARAKSDGIED